MTALQTALFTARDLSSKATAPPWKWMRHIILHESMNPVIAMIMEGDAEHEAPPDERVHNAALIVFARTFTDNAVTALESGEAWRQILLDMANAAIECEVPMDPEQVKAVCQAALAAMEHAFEP